MTIFRNYMWFVTVCNDITISIFLKFKLLKIYFNLLKQLIARIMLYERGRRLSINLPKFITAFV